VAAPTALEPLMTTLTLVPAPKPASIFDYLTVNKLLAKVTAVSIKKANLPQHLRDDAAQEMHLAWSQIAVKPEFAQSQICAYAVLSGHHAGLRLRRELGAVTAIPKSLFEPGREDLFIRSIGAATNPANIDDFTDSSEYSEDFVYPEQTTVSATTLSARLRGLLLTQGQRAVADCVLRRGLDIEETSAELKLSKEYVDRLVGQIIDAIEQRDQRRMAA
jgi:hypothetical protein